MNLILPDIGEKFAVSLSNATFTNLEGFLHEDPDLSITIDRADLEQIMMGFKSFAASIADGTAKAEGNIDLLAQIAETLVTFENRFRDPARNGWSGRRGRPQSPTRFAADSLEVRGE